MSEKWAKFEAEIIAALDIEAECRSLGVEFTSNQPNKDGWLPCWAFDRPHGNSASAAVNVGDAPGLRGRYRDLGGNGKRLSFWDLCTERGTFPDWRAARSSYATKVGIGKKFPKSKDDERLQDLVDGMPMVPHFSLLVRPLCAKYPGVTHEALALCGAALCTYPKGATNPQHCLALPAYGPHLLNSEPRGVCLMRIDGNPIQLYQGEGKPASPVKRLTKGSTGLVGLHALAQIDNADVIYKVEGISDLLALQAFIPADKRNTHLVLTNLCGASESSLPKEVAAVFAGRDVVLIHDRDKPGQEGTANWIAALVGVASSVRNLQLPFDLEETHGKDLRDWIAEGHTYDDLVAMSESTPAVTKEEAESVRYVRNAIASQVDGKKSISPLPMDKIISGLFNVTGGWPCRVGNQLFIHSGGGQIAYLRSPAPLFAFIGRKSDRPPEFHEAAGCHSKAEVFADLQANAKNYAAVEVLPHEPLVPGHYYACGECQAGDGTCLEQLLDFFSPATPVDRDLIKLSIATPFWGGPLGARPAFLITTKDGRGVGKSTVPKMVGELVGGALDVIANEDVADIKQRLLSPDGLSLRVAILDNVKSTRFSWGDLEGLITASHISGRALYVGEQRRPNVLTWFLTMNGASLSTDFAQRLISIEVKRPTHSGNWESTALNFIRDNREQLIADVIGFLRGPRAVLAQFSRWGTWERDVLALLSNPEAAQLTIAERRESNDVEVLESDVVGEFIRQSLSELGYDPARSRVFVSNPVMAEWYNTATKEKCTTTGVAVKMRQKIDNKELPNLRVCPSHAGGRGFEWIGEEANLFQDLEKDLKARFDKSKEYRGGRF
jgi:hypothetical protein